MHGGGIFFFKKKNRGRLYGVRCNGQAVMDKL